jgi:hypothetical protein
MPEPVLVPLATWQNFDLLIGSAAATLTGLMFVVITLSATTQGRRAGTTFGAYASPNVVHFGSALLVAALLIAPWPVFWLPGLLLGLCGLGGVIYVLIVLRRTRQQTAYQAVMEDWLWHIIFPLLAYAALVAAALVLPGNPTPALFISGGATVLFLFIGIHNAWDSVTYIVIIRSQAEQKSQDEQVSEAVSLVVVQSREDTPRGDEHPR